MRELVDEPGHSLDLPDDVVDLLGSQLDAEQLGGRECVRPKITVHSANVANLSAELPSE